MEHPTTFARSSALQAAALSALGAALGAAAGFGAEANLRGALTGAGIQLDGAGGAAWWGTALAGLSVGPLLWGGAWLHGRLAGPRSWSLVRIAWGPAAGLGVGLIGAALAVARVLVKGAVDAAAEAGSLEVALQAHSFDLPWWALAGLVGGAIVSTAVSLVGAGAAVNE